jgi:LCP family protein required for cell wall assembly
MAGKANQVSHTKPRPSSSQRGFSLPLWVLILVGVVFIGVAVFAGVVLFKVVRDFVADTGGPVATVAPSQSSERVSEPVVEVTNGDEHPAAEPDNPLPIFDGVQPTDRVTILVLGIDQPCVHVEEPYRSDTMILLTVDPISKSAGMLSIPRDLWVPIPGYSNGARINTAYRSGEVSEYPGGGPALAVKTVEYNLGIHINYYVTINYDAFIQVVDLIGGIDLDVPETINDPDYPDRCYGFDPFYLPAGQHHLDGEMALKYARTRATFGADFDRADRQQAVIMAILDKAMDQNVSLLTRAPELWGTYQDNVTTDMTYQEAFGLGLLVMEIPSENIHRAGVDYNYVRDYIAPDGAQVLIPIREKIRVLRDAFLSSTTVPTVEANPANAMREEAARILVLNGTWTPGLAGGTAEYLESLGFLVAGVDDAEDKDQTMTQIIDYAGMSATVDYLAQVLNVSSGSIYGGTEPDGEYEIRLVLGTDWQLPSD